MNCLRIFVTCIFIMFGFSAYAEGSKAALNDWVQNQSGHKVDPILANKIVLSVLKHSKTYGLDPFIVVSIIKIESGFNTKAKSPYGAVGLMQVVPRYHQSKIKGRSLGNIDTNIEVGIRILSEYLELHRGSWKKALRQYSGNSRNYQKKLINYQREIQQHAVLYQFRNELPIRSASVQTAELTYQ